MQKGEGQMIPLIENKQKEPIYLQIYNFYKHEILSGNLKSKSKMPSIRELSKKLKVSKTTVETAYQQLVAEGYLENLPQRGYFINEIEILDMGEDTNLELLDTKQDKFIYDYSGGSVDFGSFPYDLWKREYNKVINDRTNGINSYGDVQGEYPLRVQIAKYLYYERGVKCNPSQVVIGSGIQHLLMSLGNNLSRQKDTIVFEAPGFDKAAKVFEDLGYHMVKISPDFNDFSEKVSDKIHNSILYLTPSHQYPLGTAMDVKQRLKIIHWAEKNNGLIIEDDYDSELRYGSRPLPSMQGLSDGSRIIYIGSISKILSPAIRISYMIIPEQMITSYMTYAEKYTQTASKIEQLCLAKFMEDGYFEQHIRKIRKIYGKKNQLLLEALNKYFASKISIIGGETGHYLIVGFKTVLANSDIVERGKEKGIGLKNINLPDSKNENLIFSYAGIPEDAIEYSIKLLYESIKDLI